MPETGFEPSPAQNCPVLSCSILFMKGNEMRHTRRKHSPFLPPWSWS